MDNSSGVGVLDKAALVLSALESGPATLAGLVGLVLLVLAVHSGSPLLNLARTNSRRPVRLPEPLFLRCGMRGDKKAEWLRI